MRDRPDLLAGCGGTLRRSRSEPSVHDRGGICGREHQQCGESTLQIVCCMLAFRVGPLDAPTIAAQMQGVTPADLVGRPKHYAYARVMMDVEDWGVYSVATKG